MSEIELSLSFPLDSDGFLRRACPNCGREFKWLHVDGGSSCEEYFCPYCGASAAPDEWFTEEQLEYINAAVFDEVVGPSLEDMADSLKQLSKSSGGLVEVTASIDTPESRQAPPVFEPADMKQIAFGCHTTEPVKVDEAWVGKAYCILCGQASDATS